MLGGIIAVQVPIQPLRGRARLWAFSGNISSSAGSKVSEMKG